MMMLKETWKFVMESGRKFMKSTRKKEKESQTDKNTHNWHTYLHLDTHYTKENPNHQTLYLKEDVDTDVAFTAGAAVVLHTVNW